VSAGERRWSTAAVRVGSFHPNRAALVAALAGHVGIGVWGNGWSGADGSAALAAHPGVLRGGGVDNATANLIYATTLVGVNVHHPQTRLAGLNMRAFELLAAGVAQVVDWVPGMEELLEPGREVACYRTIEEAVALTSSLARDTTRRRELAERGRARVLREHTYVARMQTLCEAATA